MKTVYAVIFDENDLYTLYVSKLTEEKIHAAITAEFPHNDSHMNSLRRQIVGTVNLDEATNTDAINWYCYTIYGQIQIRKIRLY